VLEARGQARDDEDDEHFLWTDEMEESEKKLFNDFKNDRPSKSKDNSYFK